jgi:hypothetical protein
MKTIVNCCPHSLRIRVNVANVVAEPDVTDIVVEPRKGDDGKPVPARVSTTPGGRLDDIAGIAVFGPTVFGAVENLPDPATDTIYIVSAVVGGRPEVQTRPDVFVLGTGPSDGTVRFGEGLQKGQVYAVTRLIKA